MSIVLACVLSLLTSQEKLVRKTAIELLSRLQPLSAKSNLLLPLVAALLAHSPQLKIDPLQVPEVSEPSSEFGKII